MKSSGTTDVWFFGGSKERIPWDAQPVKIPCFRLGYNCNSQVKLCYKCNPPKPEDRHAIDLKPDLWDLKMAICSVRAEKYSLVPGCPGDTLHGARWTELDKREKELSDQIQALYNKYRNEAAREEEARKKEEEEKAMERENLTPFGWLKTLFETPQKAFVTLAATAGIVFAVGGLIIWVNRKRALEEARKAQKIGLEIAKALPKTGAEIARSIKPW